MALNVKELTLYRALVICTFLAFFGIANAQVLTFDWATAIGGAESDVGQKLAVSSDGIFYSGRFRQTVDFDPGPNEALLTNDTVGGGAYDSYLLKTNNNGDFQFVIQFKMDWQSRIDDITVDSDGSVLVGGRFVSSFDVDPGVNEIYLDNGNGTSAAFLIRYTSLGEYVESIVLPAFGPLTTSGIGLNSVAIDSDGGVVIGGGFSGDVDFDPGPEVSLASSTDGSTAFVARYNNDLSLNSWFVVKCRMYSLTIDATNNIYISGTFDGAVDFDPSASELLLESVGMGDFFIAKYSSDFSLSYAHGFGSVSDDSWLGCRSICDAQGNLYVAGSFYDEIDFDPGPGEDVIQSSGGEAAFLARYDTNGSLLWANRLVGFGQGSESIKNLTIDETGRLFVVGNCSAALADFNPGPGTNNLMCSGGDMFLSIYHQDGVYIRAIDIGGTEIDVTYDIEATCDGSIYLTGVIGGETWFNPDDPNYSIESYGSDDIFIAKYHVSGCNTGIQDIRKEGAFSISPNPASAHILVTLEADLYGYSYAVVNSLGMTLMQGTVIGEKQLLDISSLNAGVYALTLSNKDKRVSELFVVR